MRSSLSRTARQLPRTLTKPSLRSCLVPGARWTSSTSPSTQHPESPKYSTPLAKQLAEAISITGPIPVASYMRQCLTSDLGGYYTPTTTSPDGRDQFGTKGDFVTSPEISQIFGELIGVWVVAEWIAQGKKADGVYLMEVGPGRGTLMDDMLRTIRNFPPLAKAIEAVYLVEASENLRKTQHKLLCGDNPLEKTALGWQSHSRHSPDLKIIWTEDIRFIPREASKTPFIIAHEFFDALPVHIFQSVPKPPQEEQMMQTPTPTGPVKLHKPTQDSPTHEWHELLISPKAPRNLKSEEPDFTLSLSGKPTPHSMYLPETSSRYKSLLNTPEGATIEISPESQAYARDFAIRLGGSNPEELNSTSSTPKYDIPGRQVPSGPREKGLRKDVPSGAALIIDYGPPNAVPANSLRGIRAHELVSPLSSPGLTDLSCDVDFLALAETALKSSPNVEVHGPVSQGVFLRAMGIEERATQLVKKALEDSRKGGERGELTETVKRIEGGWRRLVDMGEGGMGSQYHVLAIVPYPGGGRRPVGFGGDVGV